MAQNIFQFLLEPSLQEMFRDKDTGLPLNNGNITFYKDNDRTSTGLKPVYKLAGTPSDPVFEALPNPLPLTGIGTTSDGFGTDTKVYYNPYDDEGNPELYYIEVRSQTGVLQFTREGWPGPILVDPDEEVEVLDNYFQDGQFLHHIDVENEGLITQPITNIAYGGWVFRVPTVFTSTNNVTFTRFTDYVTNPQQSPRYALNVVTTSPSTAENEKDIMWVNNNVNFLAGKDVTMQFEAVSNTGLSLNVEIYVEKFYGTGGTATETFFVGFVNIEETEYQKYPVNISITENLQKLIGDNDDDEIRFIVRLPSDQNLDVSFTNFMLVEGTSSSLEYPNTSDYDAALKSLASSIDNPAYDQTDVGKFLALGSRTDTDTPLSALVWQDPVPTGAVIMYSSSTNFPVGWLYCDGSSYDLVGPQESLQNLVSYNNLYDVVGDNYGLGQDTFTAPGGVTVDQFNATCTRFGAAGAPNAYTSGFTLVVTTPGSPTDEQVVQVTAPAGNLVPAGSYIELFAPSGRSSVYWFEVDNVGTEPTGFSPSLIKKVVISAADTSAQVATALFNALRTQVQVPDMRGLFPRGLDGGRGIDPDAASRQNANSLDGNSAPFTVGDVVGSIQEDAFQDHEHSPIPPAVNFLVTTAAGAAPSGSGNIGAEATTGPASTNLDARFSTETRPTNMYFTFIIKA